MISIEGNIGVGKTTLIDQLKIQVVKQPVDKWENTGGSNILEKFYSDPNRWAFTFQLYALHSRSQEWSNIYQENSHLLHFAERSPIADRKIFGELMYEERHLTQAEYLIYDNICTTLISMTPIKGIIYLQSQPFICLERIKKRQRKGQQNLTLEYLEKVHEKHEQWLKAQKNIKILRINMNEYDIMNIQHQKIINNLIKQFVSTIQQS